MKKELVIVLDFGGQYNQLVARRVRECNVYCEIYSYKTDIEKIKAMNPKGIILTGGPNSCYEPDSPTYTDELFKLGIPVLGLCYGAQLMSHVLGGKVERADVREYGKTEVIIDKRESKVFEGVSEKTICWMSHFDYISKIAPGFEISAHTADCPVAAAENEAEKLYAIQFHPEVLHTAEGTKMINNFVKNVCECVGDWKMDAFVENTIKEIREKVGDGRVLLALSGGVDSSVAAGLLSRAIGKQLTCVFVDHGLLRKDEGDEVEAVFGPKGQFDLNFIRVNAQERYYNKLAGVTEPEAKRKIIGEEFIRIFEEEAKKIGAVDFLAQGTIYPDVVESGLGGESAVIKSHSGILVPGGFGHRGIEGKIEAIRYARTHNIPFLGLCLGMQLSIVEFARDVIGYKDAHSMELNPDTTHPVIHIMEDQIGIEDIGGTLRLGSYPCVLKEDSLAYRLYGTKEIHERHRHRYEVNNDYREVLEANGMSLCGLSPDSRIVEMVEIPSHPWFIATQAHPELKSRPNRPHPLFKGFVEAALAKQHEKEN